MNNKLVELIRKYPISAFFIIAILLSFGLLFPAIFIPQSGTLTQLLGFYLSRLGIYSPVIAGILVTIVSNPKKQRIPFIRRLPVFVPVWLIALVIHTADLSRTAPPSTSILALILFSIPVALLPALVVSSALSGTASVRNMLASLVKPKGHFVYYLIALFAFPAIHFIGVLITNMLNGEAWFPNTDIGVNFAFALFVTFVSTLFFTGGVNEESGWRGFAQARLQQRYSPLVANLILWSFLLIWHIPNDIVQYQQGGYMLVRIGLYPFITILFGWIYNRTGGSILAPAIFHASMNSMNPLGEILPMTTAGNIVLVAFALLVVCLDRMWCKLPKAHSAVYNVQGNANSHYH